jgi:phospholipid/cholesterol/gamma-HCH transport system ATP-binding protein
MIALTTSAPLLEARGLRVEFNSHPVLTGIDLIVPRGRLLAILGKSGAGKSVLLKCLAGVLQPSAGEIRFAGQIFAAGSANLAAFRRQCSYLFQGNALLDSLTAFENVALPLEQTTTLDDRAIRTQVSAALARFELETSSDQFPGQLSGGQQKRLALARALVTRPELVLFDEPTAGLDPLRRNAVFELIVRAQAEFAFTAVIVTHDLPEALAACDTVALLDGGRIRFHGSPAEFAAADDPVVGQFRDSAQTTASRFDSVRHGVTPFALPALS